ncbi:MAG TPA: DsbC family protein [Casimicrobiaceae bacterium]|nr:DsbC family protein [Casimicrobiaceae bacterium]
MNFITFVLSRTRFAAAAAVTALALSGANPPVMAATSNDVAGPPPPEAAAIKKNLEAKFPGAAVGVITRSPYFGLFEVQFDNQIIYTDAKSKYLILGSVYDVDSKVNLTDARLKKLNRVDMASLPLDLAFKRVKGTGERKLVVFSDADCPFCAKLESELKGVDNVTIYTFLFPIDSLHPDSARKSRMIWCAPDKVKAWDDFFASGTLPDNKGECDNPVATTRTLGEKLRVQATPTLIFADGSVVPGAIPTTQMEEEFRNAAAAAAPAVARKPVAATK